MKTRTLILVVILIMAVLIITGSCATTKTSLPTNNIDELVGTWANPENRTSKTGHPFGKMVFKPDKTVDLYDNADSEKPIYSFSSIDVKEKWIDRKGAYYYEAYLNHPGGLSYGLIKISSDGKILEMMFLFIAKDISQDKLPAEIDSTAEAQDQPGYYIWYRQ